MASIAASDASTSSVQSLANQLADLCLLGDSGNEACKTKLDIKYASGPGGDDQALTDFQKFLSFIALTLQNERGPETVTALVCILTATGGADLLFTSNQRKEGELESAKMFLEELLRYVVANLDAPRPGPVKKQILWMIVAFNSSKINAYLRKLLSALDNCLIGPQLTGIDTDANILEDLRKLRKDAEFPRNMTSSQNARSEYLSACETLIKAIHAMKSPLNNFINNRAGQQDSKLAYPWCELRHCLGRLHSYRQATESIFEARTRWPKLFSDFDVRFIPSSRSKRVPVTKSSDVNEILSAAFPDFNHSDMKDDIEDLRAFGFEKYIRSQITKRSPRATVHCEVHLHNYLLQQGKTHRSDYWENSLFIATSKPPCQLCHFYFQCSDNDFIVQSSHMNLYSKWRFPDDCDSEVMEEVIESMQAHTLRLLRDKLPSYKSHDSQTGSRAGTSHSRLAMRTAALRRGNIHKPGSVSGLTMRRDLIEAAPSLTGRTTPAHSEASEEDWEGVSDDLEEPHVDG
ncbi:hypothetical protein HJFPF1_10991 [Paramyrothecium foliicola]|nr:hypothetical protein HJFPF1_10991 [Paramyrothecium foliicola]